jgi:hypothetical protein
MSSADQQRFDDQVLTRYLLGSLPEEEAEHLDELSIADDAFAWRLSAVENDLVDAYARGELSAENLAQFKNYYLSSPKRLQKVEFAEALCSFDAKTATAAAQAAPAGTTPSSRPKEGLSPWRWFSVPGLALQWGFAGVAVGMLFTVSYLLFENARLRKETTEAQGSHAGLDQGEQELQRQLNEQRAANTEMSKELNTLRESPPNLDQLKTLSALLLPPTRGAAPIPMLSVPPGTSLVVLLLALESDDFPVYRVGLKDPATNQIVWHSANLVAVPGGANKTVSISFPARLLKQQNYTLELSGVPSSGRAEFMGGYPIRVVIR